MFYIFEYALFCYGETVHKPHTKEREKQAAPQQS